MGRHSDPRKAAVWERRLARFDPVKVMSRQAVTIRFAGGAVMEIPEDREDLVKAVARALAGESEPC